MNAIEQTIRPDGSPSAGRLRIMLVLAVLVLGLVSGFGLGRAGNGSSGIPALQGPVVYPVHHGSGHVPRVWVDRP